MIKNLFNPQRLHVFAISGLLVAGNSFNSFASEKHVKQIRIDGGKMIGKIVEAPKNTPVSSDRSGANARPMHADISIRFPFWAICIVAVRFPDCVL